MANGIGYIEQKLLRKLESDPSAMYPVPLLLHNHSSCWYLYEGATMVENYGRK